MSVTIYVLCDPRKSDPVARIRYVGKTSKSLARRLAIHRCDARRRSDHRSRWIMSLGCSPLIEAIEVVEAAEADAAEIRAIARFRKMGCRLVNGTNGGDGMKNPTAATRAKLSAASKGKPLSAEHRKRIGDALRGRKMTEVQRRKYRRSWTPKRRAAMSALRTGATLSRKSRAKVSASRRGRGTKLDAASVAVIRVRRGSGESLAALATSFGVGVPMISQIVNGKRWSAAS